MSSPNKTPPTDEHGDDDDDVAPTCQDEQVVAGLPLLDDVLPLLVGALVHALHHVFDLLQLQSLQVLVLVQGVRQQLLHAVDTEQNQSAV